MEDSHTVRTSQRPRAKQGPQQRCKWTERQGRDVKEEGKIERGKREIVIHTEIDSQWAGERE